MSKRRKPSTAVVDTNLFISGSIIKRGEPHALLRAWRSGSFIVVPDEQREEIDEVLHRPEIAQKYELSAAEMAALLRRIDRTALLATPRWPLPVQVRDPKDEKILATALGGRAAYLVTGDHDLLVLDGDPKLGSLKIVTVKAFLETLQR